MAGSTKEKRLFAQHSGFLMPISLPKYLMGSSPYLPCHRPPLRVPPSQGLVPRKILTQLSRERAAHREHIYEEVRKSSGLYAASSCTTMKFSSGRGRH